MCFPATPAEQTKHGILTNLAKVYNPLGIVSPVMLDGKVLYRVLHQEECLGCPLVRRDHEKMEKVGEKPTQGSVGETQYSFLPRRNR